MEVVGGDDEFDLPIPEEGVIELLADGHCFEEAQVGQGQVVLQEFFLHVLEFDFGDFQRLLTPGPSGSPQRRVRSRLR